MLVGNVLVEAGWVGVPTSARMLGEKDGIVNRFYHLSLPSRFVWEFTTNKLPY